MNSSSISRESNNATARPRRLSNRRGAVLALVAVCAVGMMGVLVLAVDGGKLQRQRRMAQTAADAGALAGAIEKFRLRPESVTVNALGEAARNGFTNGVNGVAVTVDPSPTTGKFTGPNFVKVTVTQNVPTVFATIFGRTSVSTRSEGVAGVEASTNCLVVVDPTTSGALELEASSSVVANGCGIAVNSTSADAVSVAGGTTDLTASTIAVSGNEANPGNVTGTWVQAAPPSPDPLGYLTAPAPGACKNGITTGWSPASGTTLTAGTYCGGITVNGTLTLTGEIIIAGGGLIVGHNTLRSGVGGTVIINTNPLPGNPGSFSGMDNAQSDVILTAMPGGNLPGVVFYSNPSGLPAGVTTGISITNSSSVTMNGTVYLPNQQVYLKTNVELTINGGGLVAKTVYTKTGNGALTINGGGSTSALHRATLVQ